MISMRQTSAADCLLFRINVRAVARRRPCQSQGFLLGHHLLRRPDLAETLT
jgi:hypothetical protein